MPMGLPHRIAIVGAGLIGSALAGHLILAGNKVIIGARRPDAFTPPDYQREDIDYPVRTIDEAIDGAEVAILAIPNAAVASFAEGYRDQLAGAVIIDPSNPFLWHDDGVMTIKHLGGKTSGTVTAEQSHTSSPNRCGCGVAGNLVDGGSGTRPTTTTPLGSPPASSPKPASCPSELVHWRTRRPLILAECYSPASWDSSAHKVCKRPSIRGLSQENCHVTRDTHASYNFGHRVGSVDSCLHATEARTSPDYREPSCI
jgi:hypothetical protein